MRGLVALGTRVGGSHTQVCQLAFGRPLLVRGVMSPVFAVSQSAAAASPAVLGLELCLGSTLGRGQASPTAMLALGSVTSDLGRQMMHTSRSVPRSSLGDWDGTPQTLMCIATDAVTVEDAAQQVPC